MWLMQLSAAQGPAECDLMVAKTLEALVAEAQDLGHELAVVATVTGQRPDTYRSLQLVASGKNEAEVKAWALSWAGTVQWVCASPYRAQHGRKNWFIGVDVFELGNNALADQAQDGIRFEAMRSSGPGGQHVNKTNSAIRAVHVASGESVKVQSERSQHANKRLALALLQQKLTQRAEAERAQGVARQRQAHLNVSRGNPCRVFRGPGFTLQPR